MLSHSAFTQARSKRSNGHVRKRVYIATRYMTEQPARLSTNTVGMDAVTHAQMHESYVGKRVSM